MLLRLEGLPAQQCFINPQPVGDPEHLNKLKVAAADRTYFDT
jgi:hypothetical protein